jgi:hypothetical protein
MFLGSTKEKAVQHETVRKNAKDFIAQKYNMETDD